ncbi:MAG: hypothetical protein ACM3NZ_12870 [Betaproteobacteria bacterium]
MAVQLDSPEHFTIRVSTADPSAQPVAVRAAIYGSGTGAVELIDGLTPLQVETTGHVLSGMVQAVDSSTQVMVDVFTANRDADPRLLMRARARTVLLGDHLTRDAGHFIRGAP